MYGSAGRAPRNSFTHFYNPLTKEGFVFPIPSTQVRLVRGLAPSYQWKWWFATPIKRGAGMSRPNGHPREPAQWASTSRPIGPANP